MESATPGNGQDYGINPERVASFGLVTRTRMLQPFQGWTSFTDFTQGSLADSTTRGLMDGIPLGLEVNLRSNAFSAVADECPGMKKQMNEGR
jgi:hypothetical protein